MAIKNQDIKNILKIELLKLCDDLQIMDYQEAVNYDVYMMEIKNIAEIENLKRIRLEDYQQIIVLIGLEDLELIKKGYENVKRFGWDSRITAYWEELTR